MRQQNAYINIKDLLPHFWAVASISSPSTGLSSSFRQVWGKRCTAFDWCLSLWSATNIFLYYYVLTCWLFLPYCSNGHETSGAHLKNKILVLICYCFYHWACFTEDTFTSQANVFSRQTQLHFFCSALVFYQYSITNGSF